MSLIQKRTGNESLSTSDLCCILVTSFCIFILTGCVRTHHSNSFFGVSDRFEERSRGVNSIWLEVDNDDEPEVVLNGKRITEDEYIQYTPDVNEEGDFAYLQILNSFSKAELILNGAKLDHVDGVLTKLRLSKDKVWWVEHLHSEDLSRVCYSFIEGHGHYCIKMKGVVGDLECIEGKIFVTQFIQNSDVFLLEIYDEEFTKLQELITTDSIYLTRDGKIYLVSGRGGGIKQFHAVLEYNNEQRGETFRRSNDYLGRIGWNQNYRINAIEKLYRFTNDPKLIHLLNEQIQSILDKQDEFGLLSSKKYSLDHNTKLKLIVVNANFYYSALRAFDLLKNEALKDKLINNAKKFIDYYEQDWIGYGYSFPSCVPIEFDGVVMPYNMQHSMGLVMLKLDSILGVKQYIEKIKIMYSKFLSDIYIKNGMTVWPHWPSEFNLGWENGEFQSCNNPSRGLNTNTLEEDIWHASVTIEFLDSLKRYLEIEIPVDLEALVKALKKSHNKFSFIIGGGSATLEPKWRYFPTQSWAKYDRISELYIRRVILPYVHFDNQWIVESYLNSISTSALSGEVFVKRINYLGTEFVVVSERSISIFNKNCMNMFDKEINIQICGDMNLDEILIFLGFE